MKTRAATRRTLLQASGTAAAALTFLLATSQLQAATYTWNQSPSPRDWNNGTNWTTAGVDDANFPNAVSDVANLTHNITGTHTINLNQNITVGTLNVGDSNSSDRYHIQPGSAALGNTFTFNNGASDNILNDTTDDNDELRMNVNVAGTGVLRKTGAGAILLGGMTATNGNFGAVTATAVNVEDGILHAGGGTGFAYNIGTGGTGNTTVSSGATFVVDTVNPVNTNILVNSGGLFTIRNATTKNIGSIEGAGTFRLGDTSNTANFTNGIRVGSNGLSTTVSGSIVNGTGDTGSLEKVGTGVLTLSGNANTYSGGTTITAGTLLANNTAGSATGSGNVTVASAATLGGTGIIDPTGANLVTVDLGGILSPGASAGTLDILGNLTMAPTSELLIELGGSLPGDGSGFYDQTNVVGNSTITDVDLSLSLIDAFMPGAADEFYIFSTTGTRTGMFAGLTELAAVDLGGGYSGTITYLANWTGNQATSSLTGGNDVAIFGVEFTSTVIPEPGALAIWLLVGFAAVIGGGRLRRRAN